MDQPNCCDKLIKKKEVNKEKAPPLKGESGAASQLPCVFINSDSRQKLNHQMQKIKTMKHQNYKQNRYGK